MLKRLLKIGIISVIIALLTGCSVSRGTINSYIEPTYNSGAIKSIAMFPIRNAKFAPSEARQINKVLIQSMNKKNPNVNIVAPSKALRMINESGLASEWANFVEDYYTSGIADKKVLSKFAKALKVDAIFQGQMFNIQQSDASDFIASTTRVSVSFSIVETKTAKVIWESTSDGIRKEDKTLFDSGEAVPIKEALDLAIKKIKENMPLL